MVLTFDDGPLPKYSNQILAILAAQCVKATFFLVGRRRRPIRKACARFAMPATPLPPIPRTIRQHAPDADRARQTGDRRRHRFGHGGAWRRHRPRAVLPHSRPLPRRRHRGICRIEGHPDLERRFSRPTTGAISPPRASTISRSSGWRPRGKAFCCCTTSSRARSSPCRGYCRAESARLSHRPCRAGDTGTAGDADRATAMAIALRRPRRWRFRAGRKFPILSLPAPRRFPPPRCPIWIGARRRRQRGANTWCAVAAAIAVARKWRSRKQAPSWRWRSRPRAFSQFRNRRVLRCWEPHRHDADHKRPRRRVKRKSLPNRFRPGPASQDIKPASPQPARPPGMARTASMRGMPEAPKHAVHAKKNARSVRVAGLKKR